MILNNMIVFEGLDGAGTTTQNKLLKDYLEKKGKNVFLTHEPTDNPIGKVVRQVLQHKFTTTPEALALLYSSDRHDHLYNGDYGIIQHLEKGEFVLADRYFYSSIAYQGVECSTDYIRSINEYPAPEFVIFIDTAVDDCISRIEKRGEAKELFDRAEYLCKVRANYINEFNALPSETNLLKIDGRKSIEEIHSSITSWLDQFIL